MEPVQLGPACVRSAHRHSLEDAPVRLSQTDRPVAAIGRRSEGGVHFRELELSQAALQMSRGHLRRVHPDEQSRAARLLERSGETVAESALPLRLDLEAFRRPSVVRASENEKPPPPPGTAATASRVSHSAARASRAARSGLHGGQRRVLEKPGPGPWR